MRRAMNSTSGVKSLQKRMKEYYHRISYSLNEKMGTMSTIEQLNILTNGSLDIDSITAEDAQHVLFYYGEGGVQAGGFTNALLLAIFKADHHNKFLLAKSYPGLVTAMRVASEAEDGIECLKEIARS
jgi:hypothetical protein